MILARRSFLTGFGAALITAPAIVRAGSLMPINHTLTIAELPSHSHGVALTSIEHPIRSVEVAPNLNEQTLVDLLIEFSRPGRGLVLRPRFIHVP